MSRRRREDPGTEGGPAAAPAEGRGGGAGVVRARWALAALVALLSTGLVVGAFNPAPHTGGDNAGYLSLAYSLLTDGSFTEVFDPARMPHTKYPPVFPLLLAGLMAVGVRSWVGFKVVAAVATVVAVVASYLWAERRLGPLWAFGVASVMALSSAVVYYSHWILSDPIFLAFTMIALCSLERGEDRQGGGRWIAAGVAMAGLAYFTRSAGLPLILAVAAWLTLRRRWKSLGVAAAALGVPMMLWALRARGVAGPGYVSEFWLVNPYDPGAGRVGMGGLVERLLANGTGYVSAHVPSGIVGGQGVWVTFLGAGLVVLAMGGWLRAVRDRVGPAEVFLPLYGGLILLWPEVWSGDRFALPLYPLLLLFAASALRAWTARLGPRAPMLAGGVALATLALPAMGSWVDAREEASVCGARVRVAGSFACYGPRVEAFVDAAGWAGDNLPEGATVLTRKPRLFFVLSGVPSRTFPFSADPDVQRAEADRVGAAHVLLDEWDALAGRYVGGALQARPGDYCAVRAFGESGRTLLLGLLSTGSLGGGAPQPEGVLLESCPSSYGDPAAGSRYSSASTSIPLLDGLDP